MKKILQSVFMIAVTVLAMSQATGAYFSSTVTAADNEINTGTLLVAVDSTRAHSYVGTWNTGLGFGWDGVTPVGAPFDAYNVVYDNNGTQVAVAPFDPWENAAPGPYVPYTVSTPGLEDLADGNYSIWFTLRNWGTIDTKVMAAFSGEWTGLRTTGSCSTDEPAGGEDTLIRVKNVHLYRTGASNCENHEECRNLRDALNSFSGISYTTDADLASPLNFGVDQVMDGYNLYLSSNGANTGSEIALGAGQYAIVRMDLQFDPSVVGVNYNCYQGAQYLYDVAVTGNQLVDPIW